MDRKGEDMNKKQYMLIIVLVIISGFLGGVFSDRIFKDEQALAQKTAKSKGVPLNYGLKESEPRKKVEITEKEWKEWNKGLKETGRFQVVNGSDFSFLILDTKFGHAWIPWEGLKFLYLGRVFPGKGMKEEIVSIPSF